MPFNFTTFSGELNEQTSQDHPLWLLYSQLKSLESKLETAKQRALNRQQEEEERTVRSQARNFDPKTKNSLGNWREYFKDGAASLGSTVASSVDYNIEALQAKITALDVMIKALNVDDGFDLAKFNQIFAENYSSEFSRPTKLGGLSRLELTSTEDLLNQLRVYVNQQATDSKEAKNDLFMTVMHRLEERKRALETKSPKENNKEETNVAASSNDEDKSTLRTSMTQAIIPFIKNQQVTAPKKLSLLDQLIARIKKVAAESAKNNIPINPMVFYVEIVRWEGEKSLSNTNRAILEDRRIAPSLAALTFLPPPKSAGMLETLKKELLDQVLRNKDADIGLTEVKAIRVEALQGHDRELEALKIYCQSLIENSNAITTENSITLSNNVKINRVEV